MNRVRPSDPLRIPIEDSSWISTPFTPRDIPSVVEEYINEAYAAGLTEVRLVHGRGIGVQRGIVQPALDHHPLVESFVATIPRSHLGATHLRRSLTTN